MIGPPRHLALVGDLSAQMIDWPVPFAQGIEKLMALRGRRVVALASGDPFWFGAGSVLAGRLEEGEWRSFSGRSVFSLAASRLGWAVEQTRQIGLHAAPLERLKPELAPGRKLIVLVRDGRAVGRLGEYLSSQGFGSTRAWVLESLGGPRERITQARADALGKDIEHPVCVALDIAGEGDAVQLASGRPDALFEHDGQITKRPVRALTLSALAPKPFEHLWDIGGGSGSIAIEWLLSDASLRATTIEANEDRAAQIKANAARLGVDRLRVVAGTAPGALEGLELPEVVFIGGGLSRDVLEWLFEALPEGTRLVANAVTLESEMLLIETRNRIGGELLRIDLSAPSQIGGKTGWKAAYPIVQLSSVL